MEEAIKKLSKMKNLTISYDGGTTKHVESIYTIHVTTPGSHQSYLIEGSEKFGLSHTGPQIKKEILKVFYMVYLWDSNSNSNILFRSWIALADRTSPGYHLTALETQS